MATMTGCDACNKSSLSLLLLRPSPVPKSPLLSPPGSQNVVATSSSVNGLLPGRLPTESRFALRLLRAGYVHVYVPNPPAGVKEWFVYRVTKQADLVPEGHALFSALDEAIACQRTGHNAPGLKVLSIPQAHKIPIVWIAFSANLWNHTLRDKNKADPLVMQKIALQNCNQNTFVPTVDALKSQVLECALHRLKMDGSEEHEFAFTSLATHVNELASTLTRAAATHPKTHGKELAVVLSDPVGVAAELNASRLRRNEPIMQEFRAPDVEHALNSINTVRGLMHALVDPNDPDSFEEVGPLITELEFEKRKWPAGTKSKDLTAAERVQLMKTSANFFSPAKWRGTIRVNARMVWVIYPNRAERLLTWVAKKSQENWEKFQKYYDIEERDKWLAKFNQRMTRLHYDELNRMEKDWTEAAKDKKTCTYFDRHYDPASKLGTTAAALECVFYGREAWLISAPAPLTKGSVTEEYVSIFSDHDAPAIRTLGANRKSLLSLLYEQLDGDPGSTGSRDKTLDIMKGISEVMGPSRGIQAHAWMGNALAFYSIGMVSSLVAGAATYVAEKNLTPTVKRSMLKKLQNMLVVQRGIEFVVEGALKGDAPKIPVLITMKINAQKALDILDARSGQHIGTSRPTLQAYQAAGRNVSLTLLTDTEAIKAANFNLALMAENSGSGTVKIGNLATRNSVQQAAGAAAVISESTFLSLYQGNASQTAEVCNKFRKSLKFVKESELGRSLLDITKSLDGRLALATMAIQIIGIWNAMSNLETAQTEDIRLDILYGLVDSIVGLAGATTQWSAVLLEFRLARRESTMMIPGQTQRSGGLGALRIFTSFAAVASGGINIAISYRKYQDQKINGNQESAGLYFISGTAFAAGTVVSAALLTGDIARFLITRSISGTLVRTIATRFFGNAVLGSVGSFGVTISGVGLAVLVVGVGASILAVHLTPDEIEKWLARSYFGCGRLGFERSDCFTKGNWKSEQKALEELIQENTRRSGAPSAATTRQDL